VSKVRRIFAGSVLLEGIEACSGRMCRDGAGGRTRTDTEG
jgi:hypothetical protein